MQAAAITAGSPYYASWDTTHSQYYIADGILTPSPAAAGNVPATVTTDSNGLASFNLTYLKQDAYWIVDQLTAKTIVQGSESTSSLSFTLPASVQDMTPTATLSCLLGGPSPYNP